MKSFGLPWICVLAGACGTPKNPNPTPQSATILEWTLEQSDRTPIRTATIADPKVYDQEYVGRTIGGNGVVRVMVHLETATITWQEDGKETHFAPIKLSVKVLDADDYTLRLLECSGPHYTMDVSSDSPPSVMTLKCLFNATKPNQNVALNIRAKGDGTLDDGMAKHP